MTKNLFMMTQILLEKMRTIRELIEIRKNKLF